METQDDHRPLVASTRGRRDHAWGIRAASPRVGGSAAGGGAPMKWKVDPGVSSAAFTVRFHDVATLYGHVTHLGGTIEASPDFRLDSIELCLPINAALADHLLQGNGDAAATASADIIVRSETVEPLDARRCRVHGMITWHSRPAPIAYELETAFVVADPKGGRRSFATACGSFQWRGGVVAFTLNLQAVVSVLSEGASGGIRRWCPRALPGDTSGAPGSR